MFLSLSACSSLVQVITPLFHPGLTLCQLLAFIGASVLGKWKGIALLCITES